jgi:hypothetical protein
MLSVELFLQNTVHRYVLPTNLLNLAKDIELYEKAPKYAILETSTVNITQKDVDQILTKTVEYTPSYNSGIVGMLQQVPFFHSLYHQLSNGLLNIFMPSSTTDSTDVQTAKEDTTVSEQGSGAVDTDAYLELFSYLDEIEKEYGTQIIIFYHPTGTINKDGTIEFNSGNQLSAFRKYSEMRDIDFIDMTSDFEKMYYVDHHVAHGFVTGKLETGHLNRYGHAAIADALYEKIIKMEETK